MPEDQFKRIAAVEKEIARITEEDKRVAVVGTVVNFNEDVAIVDDGTGNIEITVFPEQASRVAPGRLVRIVGRVDARDGIRINAEAVSDLTGLDLQAYKAVKRL